MANEIQVNVQMTATNGNWKEQFQPGAVNIDQAAQGAHCPVVSVSTSEENLAVGDISTLGWIVGRNLDTTNYVTAGPTTGGSMYPFMRIEAGEPFAIRLEPGVTVRWQANTSACLVQVKLLED